MLKKPQKEHLDWPFLYRQVVLAVLQCLEVHLPLVTLQLLVVQHHSAQALPSITTWVPQPVKCLEREQRLPAWVDLGKNPNMLCVLSVLFRL